VGTAPRGASDSGLTAVRPSSFDVARAEKAAPEEAQVAKSKMKQQTGKTVLEKRRTKKAKREENARQRKRSDVAAS
jgi:hypothetical protein